MSRLNVSCMLWYVVGQNAKAAVPQEAIQLCKYTKQQLVWMHVLNMDRHLGMSVKEVKVKEQEGGTKML